MGSTGHRELLFSFGKIPCWRYSDIRTWALMSGRFYCYVFINPKKDFQQQIALGPERAIGTPGLKLFLRTTRFYSYKSSPIGQLNFGCDFSSSLTQHQMKRSNNWPAISILFSWSTRKSQGKVYFIYCLYSIWRRMNLNFEKFIQDFSSLKWWDIKRINQIGKFHPITKIRGEESNFSPFSGVRMGRLFSL